MNLKSDFKDIKRNILSKFYLINEIEYLKKENSKYIKMKNQTNIFQKYEGIEINNQKFNYDKKNSEETFYHINKLFILKEYLFKIIFKELQSITKY